MDRLREEKGSRRYRVLDVINEDEWSWLSTMSMAGFDFNDGETSVLA
jgi:hypothetical protein